MRLPVCQRRSERKLLIERSDLSVHEPPLVLEAYRFDHSSSDWVMWASGMNRQGAKLVDWRLGTWRSLDRSILRSHLKSVAVEGKVSRALGMSRSWLDESLTVKKSAKAFVDLMMTINILAWTVAYYQSRKHVIPTKE